MSHARFLNLAYVRRQSGVKYGVLLSGRSRARNAVGIVQRRRSTGTDPRTSDISAVRRPPEERARHDGTGNRRGEVLSREQEVHRRFNILAWFRTRVVAAFSSLNWLNRSSQTPEVTWTTRLERAGMQMKVVSGAVKRTKVRLGRQPNGAAQLAIAEQRKADGGQAWAFRDSVAWISTMIKEAECN